MKFKIEVLNKTGFVITDRNSRREAVKCTIGWPDKSISNDLANRILEYMNNESDLRRIENKTRTKIFAEILEERIRQNDLWGEQNYSPAEWMPILLEELGEAATAYNDKDKSGYREELIHATAVLVQMIECFDRNEGNRDEKGYEFDSVTDG